MSRCKSIYYGQEADWRCYKEEGHDEAHCSADTWTRSQHYEEGYCSWLDFDVKRALLYSVIKELEDTK